jgi:TetR/AcrR family transcriptional regulator, fatty acid biosynthesis regulator
MTRSARRRLSPEARREEILDETARIVLVEGVSAVSMERLGREAGVSKALVYAYFPNRIDLLSALLLREYRHFQAQSRALVAQVEGFRAIVEATTAAWLDHVAERGPLISRLMGEPEIARAIESVDAEGRQDTARYFGRLIADAYGNGPIDSAVIAEMLMGLTGAAGVYLGRSGADRDKLLKVVTTMLFAALDAVHDGS